MSLGNIFRPGVNSVADSEKPSDAVSIPQGTIFRDRLNIGTFKFVKVCVDRQNGGLVDKFLIPPEDIARFCQKFCQRRLFFHLPSIPYFGDEFHRLSKISIFTSNICTVDDCLVLSICSCIYIHHSLRY